MNGIKMSIVPNHQKQLIFYEYLNKACGKYRNRGWWGYKIVYDAYDSGSDEDESKIIYKLLNKFFMNYF